MVEEEKEDERETRNGEVVMEPQSSDSNISETSDRQLPPSQQTDDRSVVSDASSYVNSYVDKMVDGIVEDETLEEVDSEYENSDSAFENDDENENNNEENKEENEIEPLTSIRTETTTQSKLNKKKNKKKKDKKVKPPFNNRVDPKNKRVIPEYKYYDLEHMTPVGYKIAMKNLKDYEKAKKKDEEEKVDHYMKLKSKEIFAKKKYATKVTKKYKPPHKYTLKEIINMGYPDEPPTPTTTETSEADEGYAYMKQQDFEGVDDNEPEEDNNNNKQDSNKDNNKDNNDISNLGYNSDDDEDNDNIGPLPNENELNDTHYETETKSYKLSNNTVKSGGPVLSEEEINSSNGNNVKRPPTSKRITEMTYDNCETPNTEASTPCSTGRMLASSRSERRALKKEKKRQRRLFRGVMNSACFFFSLYAKVKERRMMNPKMQSRLKNAKDNEYQHALKIVTITASKKYGPDPPERNKKLEKILNKNRVSKDKDLDYYIKYMKQDIKEDHTRDEIRMELRKRIEKIKNEHTEKVKWDTDFETIYQRFLIQHKVMLKNITPFHLMEKFTDCFEFKLALEKGTKSKRVYIYILFFLFYYNNYIEN